MNKAYRNGHVVWWVSSLLTLVYATCPPSESTSVFRRHLCNTAAVRECLCSTNVDTRMTLHDSSSGIRINCGQQYRPRRFVRAEFNVLKITYPLADDSRQYMIVMIETGDARSPNVKAHWLATNIAGSALRRGMEPMSAQNVPLSYPPSSFTEAARSRLQMYTFETNATGASLSDLVDNTNRGEFQWQQFLQNNNLCDKLSAGFQLWLAPTPACVHNATCEPACGVSILCLQWPTVSCGDQINAANLQELQLPPTVTWNMAVSGQFYFLSILINDGNTDEIVWNVVNLAGDALPLGTALDSANITNDYQLPVLQNDRFYVIHAYMMKAPGYVTNSASFDSDFLLELLRGNGCDDVRAMFSTARELPTTRDSGGSGGGGTGGSPSPTAPHGSGGGGTSDANLNSRPHGLLAFAVMVVYIIISL